MGSRNADLSLGGCAAGICRRLRTGKTRKGVQATQATWLFIAAIMLVPILLVVLTLTLEYPAIRWVNIIVAILLIVFNIFGLPYKGAYDNFLIGVSLVFNLLTVWCAWKWVT
jgi:ABC-type transport system involved in Fe-S cluster assembly fused permease/ATPase subunit